MRNDSSRHLHTLAAIGLICCSTLSFYGCRKQGPQGWDRPPAAVSSAAATAKDVPLYLDEIGKCVPREVVSIAPQVPGRITDIHFADGADVKAGDALFTIDPRPYQAQVDSAEAALSQSTAALGLAKLELGRAQDLFEKKFLSQQDFDKNRSSLQVAEAKVRQDKAGLETARLNLQYCSIRSPIDGRTGRRLVDAGNVVAPGGAPLLVVERLDPIYADFAVSENDLTAVQKNMGRGGLTALVSLPDEPGDPIAGKLTFLDNAVGTGTGTVNLRATVPNGTRRLWPGRLVKVRLLLGTISGAVLVPAAAPQSSAKGPYVYVIKEDGTADFRSVTLGQRQGDSIVIAEGLKPGEKVIVAGQMGVTPGGKVREESAASSSAAPATASASAKS